MLRESLMSLLTVLTVSVVIEALVPIGKLTPYVRYFVGVLFLLVLFNMGSALLSINDLGAYPETDLTGMETQFNERVIRIQEEKIAADLLREFSGCVSVSAVECGNDGTVKQIKIVADQILSRAAISERYGVSEENIFIQGAGER